MTRFDLLERLAEVITSDKCSESQRESAKNIFEQLTHSEIELGAAEDAYQNLILTGRVNTLTRKRAYVRSLRKLQRGELDHIGACKMLSSIITHEFIEVEDKGIPLDKLEVEHKVRMLLAMLVGGDMKVYGKALIGMLEDSGYFNEKEET